MQHEDDLLIIRNVLAGDSLAYAKIVDTYKDMAVSLAYNILLNREDAEEAAQDAFLKAYQALKTFRGHSKFSTWLYRIIINISLNKKKKKKQLPAVADLEEQDFMASPDTNNAQQHLVNSEQKKHIRLALRSLNEQERICITLHYLYELSVQEVNEATGISPANVKVILHRARKHLYQCLQNNLKGEVISLI